MTEEEIKTHNPAKAGDQITETRYQIVPPDWVLRTPNFYPQHGSLADAQEATVKMFAFDSPEKTWKILELRTTIYVASTNPLTPS